MKYLLSFGVLGLLGIATANASTVNLNLNTGDGDVPYTILSDTLSPNEGKTVYVVTQPATYWLNDLTSEWIAPMANQSWGNTNTELPQGSVTYQVQFTLPSNYSSPNLSIILEADDWAAISLNGYPAFYTGPSTGQWKTDTTVPIQPSFASALNVGVNTMYFTVYNWGSGTDAGGMSTGLDAQVNLSYNIPGAPPAPTPEPSTIVPLIGSVLLGGFVLWRRRQTA